MKDICMEIVCFKFSLFALNAFFFGSLVIAHSSTFPS